MQGRIATLVVVKENSIHGYRNGEILCLNKGQETRCPENKGDSADTDIIEELIRLTVKNGGRVEFLDKETPAADEINKHSGVGALLRY